MYQPTHLANIPSDNDWEETWEKVFTKAMNRMLELEELSHGKDDKEFEELKEKLLTKVIPRLLRPLESGGQIVTPCLVHSDLWPGNCMPDADADEIMISPLHMVLLDLDGHSIGTLLSLSH